MPPLHRDQPALAIVGASVRAAASSAMRSGWKPWCADLFCDADLVQHCSARVIRHYPHDLPKHLRSAPPGPWMYVGALENSPNVVEEIARQRELWGNGATQLQCVRDPWRLADAVRRHGFPAPEVRRLDQIVSLDGTWLLKRRRSAGGQQIRAWDGVLQAERPETHFLQQFIAGIPFSAVFVAARGDARLLGMTQQLIGLPWTGARGFRYAGSLGRMNLGTYFAERLSALGKALSVEFQLAGLFGVDFIWTDQDLGIWTVEVNPRYTASVEVLERATGLQAIHWHMLACREGRLPLPGEISLDSPSFHGKAILFADHRFVVSPALTTDLLARNAGRVWPEIADIPSAGSAIEAGWPVATVFAEGSSSTEVLERLQERVSELRRRFDKLPEFTGRLTP